MEMYYGELMKFLDYNFLYICVCLMCIMLVNIDRVKMGVRWCILDGKCWLWV